jgi:hypothetical protein
LRALFAVVVFTTLASCSRKGTTHFNAGVTVLAQTQAVEATPTPTPTTNHAPTLDAIESPQVTSEDTTKIVAFTGADGDAPLNCSATNALYTSTVPTVVASSGAIAWSGSWPNCTASITPVSNANGSTVISIAVSDGEFSASRSFTLSVAAVDDAPVATSIAPTAFNEDTAQSITLAYSDVENDKATACTLSNLSHVTETTPCACNGSGVCTVGVTGTSNYNGAAGFSYTVTANGAVSNSATATLSITAVNDAPTTPTAVSLTPASATSSSTLTCSASGATDVDAGNTVTYSYSWFKNDTVIASQTASTLSGQFTTGDSIVCKASATDGTLSSAVVASSAVVIQAAVTGTPTKLAFGTQPGGGFTSTSWSAQPVVLVQDASGNTVTSSTASVTIAIGTNPSSGTLSGTATVSAVAGVATFSGLSINSAGTGYTLVATSGSLTSATSSAFNITAIPTVTLVENGEVVLSTYSRVKALAYANGYWIAGAQGANICRSTDARSWGQCQSVPSGLTSVVYGTDGSGNGRWVAVGSNFSAYSDNNGAAWTVVSSGVSGEWLGVTYGNGKFVAVATNSVMYSANGATWTVVSSGVYGNWKGVTYGNGTFVAVESNRVIYSSDGASWTAVETGNDPALWGQWNGVTFGNGKFVAVAWNCVMSSANATAGSWTKQNSSSSLAPNSIAFGKGKYFIYSNSSATTPVVQYSSDALTWTDSTAIMGPVDAMASDGTKIVAISSPNNVSTNVLWESTDGGAFTRWETAVRGQYQDLAYGNGTYVAMGEGNSCLKTSPDGINWTQIETNVTHPDYGLVSLCFAYQVNGLSFGNGTFVAVGKGYSLEDGAEIGAVLTSPDGTTWTVRTPPVGSESTLWTTVAYGGGVFVAIGLDYSDWATVRFMRSADNGVTWTMGVLTASGAAGQSRSLTYGNGKFVFVYGNDVWTLPDGETTWAQGTLLPTDPNNVFWSVTHDGTKFVASGGGTATSSDGITWSRGLDYTQGVDIQMDGIWYGNGLFLGRAGNTLRSSLDGVNWTTVKTYDFGLPVGAFVNNRFLFMNSNSAMEIHSQ